MRWTLSLLFAVLSFARPAWGQSAREPRQVALHVQTGEPSVSLELWNSRRTELLGNCDDTCQLTVPVGKYQLLIYQRGQLLERRRMVIRYPVRWTVQLPDQEASENWRGVGVVGTLCLVAGTLIASYGVLADIDFDGGRGEHEGLVVGGLVVAGVGVVMSPLGWTMYAQNSLRVDSEALSPEQQRAPALTAVPRLRLSFSF